MKNIILLGASGSIGTQTIDVCDQHPDMFKIIALSVGKRVDFLIDYLKNHPTAYACIGDEKYLPELREMFPQTTFYSGDEGLLALTSLEEEAFVINALQGFVGLLPTLNSVTHHHDTATANKESLVAGGSIVMKVCKENGVNLIPIDSEHCAIFQCLQGNNKKEINRLIITASGGSFRNLKREELKDVTVEQALKHPNWSMGSKITIDSATMMNKGFEVIEAHWLFDVDYDHIDVLLHPESMIHSMVEYQDHSVMAQLANPDMRVCIQYALSQPARFENTTESLDLAKIGTLHFSKMDEQRYPLIKLAYDTAKKGGNLTAALNGANESAVRAFLNKKCRFLDIEDYIFKAVAAAPFIEDPTIEQIIETDKWAREFVDKLVEG